MNAVEAFGLVAIIVMVASYGLENRHPAFVLSFAIGCAAAAFYAALIESYPFLIAEAIWAVLAFRRWLSVRTTA